eukprot:464390_1
MSKGNWSEWLGAPIQQETSTPTSLTPHYVALTDDTSHHTTSSIPALSNTSYHHYNSNSNSYHHYNGGYNTSYYYHSNSNSNSNGLQPPSDYYNTINKNKKHKKHNDNNIPMRPPKPLDKPSISSLSATNIQSKQYELIISNVPSQIRSRELHNALNAVKCHLTDFYIPDYNKPSTIIIIVKGFVQWRQLSKLNQIQIRGVKCPIKPKPLKSLKSLQTNHDNDNKHKHKNKHNDNNTLKNKNKNNDNKKIIIKKM